MIVCGGSRAHAVPGLGSWLVESQGLESGDGLRTSRVWKRLLAVEHAVVESVELSGEADGEVLVVVGAASGLPARSLLAVRVPVPGP